MRLFVTIGKKKEQGMVVGYAPGKKGSPRAIVLVGGKLFAVKLKQIEVEGFAKIQKGGLPNAFFAPDNMSRAQH